MNKDKIVGFLKKYYLLIIGVLIIGGMFMDLVLVTQEPLDLKDGGNELYWQIIDNVIHGNGYKACEESYIPNCAMTDQVTAMREPLPVLAFALVAYLTKGSSLALQLTQSFFDLLLIWLIFLLGKRIANTAVGLVAAFVWMTYLPVLRVEAHLNGDILAGVLVTSGILLFLRAVKSVRMRDWIFFGFVFGLSVLTRSSTVLVALALLGLYGLRILLLDRPFNFSKFRNVFAAFLVLALTVSPWVIRNMLVFQHPVFSTTLVGYNLYRHNVIVVPEVFPHYVGSQEAEIAINALVERTPQLRTPINEAEVDKIYQREALKLIATYPDEYAELVIFRFIPLWFNIGVFEQYGKGMLIVDYLAVVQQAFLLFVFVMAIRNGDWVLRFVAAGLGVFILSYMAVDSQLRYLIPIMPVIIVIGVLGFYQTAWKQYLKPKFD